MTDRNRREFVFADSPEHDFLCAGIRVKTPCAVLVDEWERERPVFGADIEGHRPIDLATKPVHLLVFLDEQFAVYLILAWVA